MNKLIDSLSKSVVKTSISLPQSLWSGRCYWDLQYEQVDGLPVTYSSNEMCCPPSHIFMDILWYWDLQYLQVDWLPVNFFSNDQ